jgi:UDP-2,4-diacetamido-2,4,6-trideoxy-beta-L-altropyranose hydrolase
MRIIFRTDASIEMGGGHVMRCISLAQELVAEGYHVVFVCRPQAGDFISYIESKEIEVIRLEIPVTQDPKAISIDYSSWLKVPVAADAKEFIAKISKVDVVVTDHYSIGREWHSIVKNALRCKIITIDDLGREHNADLVIDQTLGCDPQKYAGVGRCLVGSEYALLRPCFRSLREKAQAKTAYHMPARVLVSMGGMDKDNVTLLILSCLANCKKFSITVLLGASAPNYSTVKDFCNSRKEIEHLGFVDDIASVMLENDIAVGAPGSTSWERACLGLPNVIVPVANNQAEISRQLISNNASLKVDVTDIAEKLEESLDSLLLNWNYYRSKNFKICDGYGTKRVIIAINELLRNYENNYTLQ